MLILPKLRRIITNPVSKTEFFVSSRNKNSTYWTNSIKMHWWVCLWTRSWASLTLCSFWTQEDAQTTAGHILKDIWGSNKVTNQYSLRAEGCLGLCLGFAPLVESEDFKRKTTLPNTQLLLWAKHPSYETINSKSVIPRNYYCRTQPLKWLLNSIWKTHSSFGRSFILWQYPKTSVRIGVLWW